MPIFTLTAEALNAPLPTLDEKEMEASLLKFHTAAGLRESELVANKNPFLREDGSAL
jgi:hypothetical protein